MSTEKKCWLDREKMLARMEAKIDANRERTNAILNDLEKKKTSNLAKQK
jgi:hypothetical protein